jgi:hypothetical protein
MTLMSRTHQGSRFYFEEPMACHYHSTPALIDAHREEILTFNIYIWHTFPFKIKALYFSNDPINISV